MGIAPNATKEQIKSAYRKLSMKFHPDKNDGDFYFETMFKNINEANEILSDDKKRANYNFQFKQFTESKNNNFADQAEMRRKEEELRRKQEELYQKEQELKRQQHRSQSPAPPPVASQTEPEFDWGKVSNFFILLNVLLLGLILVTPNKNGRAADGVSKVKNAKLIQPPPAGRNYSTKSPKVDTTDDNTYLIDTVREMKASISKENEVVEEKAKTQVSISRNDSAQVLPIKIDSVDKKPKWYQFKKLKEWKKKQKEQKK